VFKARALGLLIAGPLVAASAAHADKAQDMAAIQNFRLTDDYLAKYQAVEDDIVKDPCRLAPLGVLKGGNKSLDQMVAAYDAQPAVHAMLARHGLSAREQILGMLTLAFAGLEIAQQEHPGAVHSSGTMPPISPDNLAFYKAHEAALKQHIAATARQQLAANHGKLPACTMHQ
jgi:hypothetical protein